MILLRPNGFTLVELLVAMLLGIVLSFGIVNVFIQSKADYSQDEELARMQENARYALRLLSREITLAGLTGYYSGIASRITGTPNITNDCGTHWAVNISEAIAYTNNATSSPYSGCISDDDDIKDNTDVLVVRRTADDYSLADGDANTGVTIKTSGSANKRVYLKKSGKDYSFIHGASVTPGDTTSGSGVDLWEYYASVFFVRPYSDRGDGIPTLCILSLTSSARMRTSCYIEGVEDFQLEFGIDSDDDGVVDQYKATATTAEVDRAVAVRVHLLIRSINTIPQYSNTKAYNLGNAVSDYMPSDSYYRRVYSTTIILRNADNA